MLENTIIWTIITIFTIILEWAVLNKIIIHTSYISVSKLNLKIILTAIILVMIYMNLVDIYPDYRIIIGVLTTIIYYKYICDENIIKVIFMSLIYWMILLGLDSLSMSLTSVINSLDTINQLIESSKYRLEAIILSKSLLILISVCYCKVKVSIDINKRELCYILIPIITNMVSFLAIYRYIIEIKYIDVLSNKEILLITLLLVLSNVCLILSIRKIIVDNKLIAEGKLIKEKIKMQHIHYINMQQDHMKVRQLHHDIKNHIACIKGVNSNEATNYIRTIEMELDKYDNSFNTGNMILDIILIEKSKVCKQHNIKLLIDINNFDTCNFIDSIDICSIFSNILDNAIESCEKIRDSKREIILRGTIVNEFFVIRIENTKQNKVNIKNNNIKTDKKNTYLHGLGIKNIKDSVFKYNGEVVIDCSENIFILKIFIPLVPK